MDYYTKLDNHPYAACYLDDAMNILGQMFDYGYYDLHLDMQKIFDMFLDSGVAAEYGAGFPKYVGGMVGRDVFRYVQFYLDGDFPPVKDETYSGHPDMPFWTGWIIAYYQWTRNITFDKFRECGVTMDNFEIAYPALHTASEERACLAIDEWFKSQPRYTKEV